MRGIVLAVVAIQLALGCPVFADDPPASDRPLSELLPLFEANHCANLVAADQLFCGDPELSKAQANQSIAIEARLNRLPNKRLAIAENADWIKNRNSSCGIFGRQGVSARNLKPIKACLLRETEERTAILDDPNFDCLATNTTAGLLICSDPVLAIAKAEFNEHVLALVARLKGDEAKQAYAEYERWTRQRDRKCDLLDKDNVPLEELSSSESCLAEDIGKRDAEILAAKGDPKKIFGQRRASSSPDADAVDLCVAQIQATNACDTFLTVNRVQQIDREVTEREAQVVAKIEMVVLSPFAVCSPIASTCTGSCWDMRSGQAKPNPGTRESIPVGYRLKIQKSFAFQKANDGWRCNTGALQPVDLGIATVGP